MRVTEAHRTACLKNLEKAMAVNCQRHAKRVRDYFNCRKCGVAVICKPSSLGKKTYCSMACMAEDYKTALSGSSNPNFKNSGRKICKGCLTPFKSYNPNRYYCTLQCYRSLEISRENARMNGRKSQRGGRCDHNQPEIVTALRAVGASVLITANQGGGFPDLVVGWRGENYLLEVKNPKTSYGKQGFSKSQQAFNAGWQGSQPIIVYSPDEALRIIGAIK